MRLDLCFNNSVLVHKEIIVMTAFEKLRKNGIIISEEDIRKIVIKYQIKEIAVFGSSIRDDFDDDSDIDMLIEFHHSEAISLYDIIDIQEYFETITKRAIDIVEPAGLCNPYRRAHISKTKEILYAA